MLQAEFDRIGNDARRWVLQGNELWHASRCLLRYTAFGSSKRRARRPDLTRTVLLLRAFAFECFFKTMWLKSGNKLATGGQFAMVPGVNNHDLPGLADKVTFPLEPNERECLSRLTHFGVFGRYPINQNWQVQENKSFWSTADEHILATMIRRISLRLKPPRGRRRRRTTR